jgi:hypothetical protein
MERGRKRTILQVLDLLKKWTGVTEGTHVFKQSEGIIRPREPGDNEKLMTRKQAALLVGLPIKSMEDYLLTFRMAKDFEFDFNSNLN